MVKEENKLREFCSDTNTLGPLGAAQKRLKQFKEGIPQEFPQELKGDFAAELQWKSWQIHLKELEDEIEKYE